MNNNKQKGSDSVRVTQQPNISKLEVGMKFKSFKELVEFTELNFTDGGANRLVLEMKLRKYINFENIVEDGKKKRAIVITEIF